MRESRPKEIRIPDSSASALSVTIPYLISLLVTRHNSFLPHEVPFVSYPCRAVVDTRRKGGARESQEPKVGHGASPALSGRLGPGSAGLCFGLAPLAGDALWAAESTMRAERPKVPGCSCCRIFLSSEISLVLLQGNRENAWFLSKKQTPFCSPKLVAFNQESQFAI